MLSLLLFIYSSYNGGTWRIINCVYKKNQCGSEIPLYYFSGEVFIMDKYEENPETEINFY